MHSVAENNAQDAKALQVSVPDVPGRLFTHVLVG